MSNEELQNAANSIKKNITEEFVDNNEDTNEEDNCIDNTSDDDIGGFGTESNDTIDADDDDIGGFNINGINNDDDNEEDDSIEEDESFDNIQNAPYGASDEELREVMPDIPEADFKKKAEDFRNEMAIYSKNLVIHQGFSPEESLNASRSRFLKLAAEENEKHLEKNPNLGIVTINKSQEDKVEFTKEEKEKLTKVKAIKLQVVEDVELSTLKIAKVDKKHKGARLQILEGGLSKYSTPLPITADYAIFKGAQTMQLIQAVKYDDDNIEDVISKKAALLYDRYYDGTLMHKTDENNHTILTYNEFINKYYFHDMDLGIYAILVASSMEEVDTELDCGGCNESFHLKYNMKSLLNMDDISDTFKGKIDNILTNKGNSEEMQLIRNENDKALRLKSPISNNVYEISYPSIARAINIYKLIDQKDDTMVYLSAIALFTSNVYIYDEVNSEYIRIEDDEYSTLMNALQAIPQNDLDMILSFLKDMLYTPKFILKSKCPHCGNEMVNTFNVDNLVFLKARDSSTEII